jgi:Sulfatase-modifying factor enzyme 1
MRLRRWVLVPFVTTGLAVALSCGHLASANDSPKRKAAKAAPKKSRKESKHHASRDATGQHSTPAISLHNVAEFDEGQLPSPRQGATCPAEMANVEGRFCIDRWEGALVETLSDGEEVPWPPFGPIGSAGASHRLRAVSVPNVFPQAYISGAQASRACAAAGKRLCAPIEWRKACMGPNETTFGYGNERVAGRCNDSGYSPMLRLYPEVAESWTLVGMTEMNDARLNQLQSTLAPTGLYEGCTNGYGVFDMIGNLHEWTNDPNGTFQGGYYLDTHKNGDGCEYRTVAHEFTYHDYSTGFRCCAEPVVL